MKEAVIARVAIFASLADFAGFYCDTADNIASRKPLSSPSFRPSQQHDASVQDMTLMFALLTMNSDLSEGQWLLVTLTAGVGGAAFSPSALPPVSR
jgi:hypothetical protein